MADAAPDQNTEPLEASEGKDRFGFLQQIDFNNYKQLLIFLGISVVISIGLYIFIRLGQESVVRQNVKKPTEQVTQPKSDKTDKTQITFNQDQQRKNDIVLINSALKAYFLTNKQAPELLDDLVPKDLPELPIDPKTDQGYIYSPADDLKSWKVSAELSDGASFEVSGP